MNLSKIKAACSGGKRARIYSFLSTQWISNGFAAYRVRGIEINSEEALLELWNLSEKAREKAAIMMEAAPDPRFRTVVEDEEELTLLGMVGLNEVGQYVGLRSQAGVIWIDAEWLKPLKLDYARYFARWRDGRPMVAVYEDLEGAEALILPVSNGVANEMMVTAMRMGNRAFNWPDPDAEAKEVEEAAEALMRETSSGADTPHPHEGEGFEGEDREA